MKKAISIRLDEKDLSRLKADAKEQGTTLTRVIEKIIWGIGKVSNNEPITKEIEPIKETKVKPVPSTIYKAIPSTYPNRPENGQYVKAGKNFIFNVDGKFWAIPVNNQPFIHDSIEYHLTEGAGYLYECNTDPDPF